MTDLLKNLQDAGLPVVSVDGNVAKFSTPLSPTEQAMYERIASPDFWVELRRREYPPLADLADALYWESQGDISFLERYMEKCALVKMTYPKP